MKEIVSLRKPREKYFKHANGLIDVYLFDSDIHYQKDGIWQNIDNSWVETNDCYRNSANSLLVYLSKKKTEELMKMNLGSDEFSIFFPNKSENVTSFIKDQSIYYENILQNIDIKYELIKNKLKDTIILKNIENNFNDLQFKLTDTVARLENNQIILEKNGRTIGKLETPTLLDNQNNSYSIKYILNKNPDGYTFTFEIDENILKNKDLYPLIIDPILSNGEENSVFDTYIYEGDETVDRNNTDILKVGVDQNNKVYRSLLKFNLPTIGTGCDIVGAKVTLVSHIQNYEFAENYRKRSMITAHEMTSDWEESTANWNHLHKKYKEEIEDYFLGTRSLINREDSNWQVELKEVSFDITNLVKRWYAGFPNYGLMLKWLNEVSEENNPEYAFYSKNNTITETTNPKPFLIISYRNQNGLENYMTYQNISYRDGNSYINNLTGNLTNVFELSKTIGGTTEAKLNLVYNTNDVILNHDYGYGLGYKLNYHQTLKEIKIDSEDYLEYLDEDGTIHYFYKEDNTYKDEDGLNLIIKKENNDYVIEDKVGNKMIFGLNDNTYYLTKIKDSSGNITTITYENKKIIKIEDSNHEQIIITYGDNSISVSNNYHFAILTYEDNQVVTLWNNYGKTFLTYQNKLISKITEEKSKSMAFEYYNTLPYRLRKMTEIGLNGTLGNSLEFHYGFQVTRIIDNKGRVNTYTFNKIGNTTGITNLKTSDDFIGSYGNYKIYDDINAPSKNKLLLDTGVIKYTNNMFLERGEKTIKGSGGINLPEFRSGGKYTISGLFKTDQDNVSLEWVYFNPNGFSYTINKIDIPKSKEYQKCVMTVSVDEEHDLNSYLLNIASNDNDSLTKIKELQIEPGEMANYYNLIINSDFQNDMDYWIQSDATDTEGNIVLNDDEIVTLPNGKKAYHRKCYYNQSKSLDQEIPISGHKNDTYRLSFWYKNNGIREDGMFAGHIITLGFHYPNEEIAMGTQMHNLKIHGTEWQFFNMTFTTHADYDSVRLSIISQTEVNDLYITHITLTKDVGSNSYNYDDHGNLVSAIDQSKEKQTFYYDKNNQLISTFEPKGNHFKFEYDNLIGTKLLQGISTKGIANKIEYDEHNNPIQTRIQKLNSKEINNKDFYIRKKGTKQYIIPHAYSNSISLEQPTCNKESWTLEKVDNNYTLKSSNSEKYINKKSDNVLELSEKSMLFELIPNDNGSYILKPKEENLVITANNNILELTNYTKDDANQEFYLELLGEEKYIETKAAYTKDGKFITNTTDALGKVTTYDIDFNSGLMKSIRDANNNTTYYTYNDKEQISKVEKENRTIEYEYNDQDLLSKIICPNKEYHFIYDDFLNAKTVKINNNILVTNDYEPNNGNLVKTNYGNNTSVSYTYDEMDRIHSVIKDKTYKHYYNNQNELVKIEAPNEIYQYYYDFAGRIEKYLLNEDSIKYEYDVNSNVLQKTFSKNNQTNNINYTYDEDDSIIKVTFDDQNLNYTYDSLGRLINSNINNHLPVEYEYYSNGNKTSFVLKSMKINNDQYEYTYDNLYNIKTIRKNKILQYEYTYDNFNELIKENNYIDKKTIKYTYDSSGNIISKKQCEFKTDNVLSEDTYEYNNESWKDQLTKFNNTEITYDQIGNPLTIGNQTLLWQNGRELKELKTPSKTISYTYNKDGIRKSKTINNVTTNYFTENSTLIFEETTNNMLYFIRDDNNKLLGFKYNDTIYYYQKNIQEDITGIYDSNYNLIATYEYDSWGKILSIKDNLGNDISTNSSHIANINPFRYRSYYYDKEVELYYLNSRYYNPEWGRFINVDEISGEIGNILSHNMYQYAFNNPISFNDDEGDWPNLFKAIGKVAVGVAVIAVGATIATTVGAVASVGAAIMTGVKVAATVAIVSSGVRAVKKTIQAIAKKEPTKKVVEQAMTGAVNGFSDGFLGGAISSGIGLASSTYKKDVNGIKIGETEKSNYGKITIGYSSQNGLTIFNLANSHGKSFFRVDSDSKHLIHAHFESKNHGMGYHRTMHSNIVFGIIIGAFGD